MQRDMPEENSEQRDADQAQDVASDALTASTDLGGDTERGGTSDPAQIIPDDEQDVVERMNAMVTSGHIDNGAFAGEPQMDDEEDYLGNTEDVDDDI